MTKNIFSIVILLLLSVWTNAQEYLMQNGTVTTCSGRFYDSGGNEPPGLFQNNENYVFTICPDAPDLHTRLTFDGPLVMSESGGDFMRIYDGDSTSAPLLGTFVGGQTPGGANGIGGTDTNTSGCLTIEFISDAVAPAPGWAATIDCYVPCQVITPNITTNPALNADGNVEVMEDTAIEFNTAADFSQDGTGATYLWDFGDGTTSTETNPTHTYTDPGTYTVTLTITDNSGDPDCAHTETFLAIIEFDANTGCPEVHGEDYVNNSNDVLITCDYPMENGVIRLNADYVPLKSTSSYSVESIPFRPPFDVTEGSEVVNNNDDKWSAVQNFPAADGDIPAYRFCYFEEEKDALVVGANGRLSFDLTRAYPATDQWEFDSSLPVPANTTEADMFNTINGAYHDMDIRQATPGDGAQFSYGFEGTYPCRMFVVNYNNIPHYSCNSMRTTQQIILYEATNVIDVYIHQKPTCDWNSGNALIGLMGYNPTQFAVPPGRNTGPWEVPADAPEAWRFRPDGDELPVTFAWYDADGNLISTSQDIEVSPTEDTHYTVTVTYEICGGENIVVEDRVDVHFDNNPPDAEDQEIVACDVNGSGAMEWNLTVIENSVLNGHEAGSDQEWTIQGYYTDFRPADEGNAADAIADPTAYYSSAPVTLYVRIEASNGCYQVIELDLEFQGNLEPEDQSATKCTPTSGEAEEDLTSFDDLFTEGEERNVFYYVNEADAAAGNDSYIADPTSFTYSEDTILYVRVATYEGCYGLAELELLLTDVPDDYTFDEPVEFCDTEPLGSETIDLTTSETNIAGGQTGLTFVYYTNEDDANANNTANAIADPTQYELSTASATIYVVVMEADCFRVISMPVVLNDGLTLNNVSIPLCDIDNDGTETFDLTLENENIISPAADYTFTYYATTEDIDNGNAIATSTAYASGSGTVYAVVTNSSGCTANVPIELTLNDVPVSNPATLSVCLGDDGTSLIYNLTDAETDLLNGQTGYTLTYYNSQAEAEVPENPIADTTAFSGTDGQVVYVRLESSVGCYVISTITLAQSPQPTATAPGNIATCDLDAGGSENIDLSVVESTVLGGQTGMTVTYHSTQEDADNNANAFTDSNSHSFDVGTTTVYIRVENSEGCYETTSFDVTIYEGVEVNAVQLSLCDIDNDGTETFDLTLENENIISPAADYTFTYYATTEDIDNGNAIATPTAYASGSGTVYAVVANSNGCTVNASIELILNDVPVSNPATLSVCLGDDGTSLIYNLTDAETDLLNGQTGYTLTYYNSQAEAEVPENPIADTTTFSGTDGQVVYVRLDSSNGCYVISTITLAQSPQPTATAPSNIATCDLDASGSENIDVSVIESIVLNGQTGMTVTYHSTQEDADNNANAFTDSSSHSFDVGTTTVYIRVENSEGCYETTSFDVLISQGPEVTNANIELCDIDGDNTETFDLTSVEDTIIQGVSGYIVSYHNSADGVANNDDLITNPSAFDSGNATVYVRVEDPTSCTSMATITLVLKDLPNVADVDYTICDDNYDGIYSLTLSDLDDLVISGSYNISYFTSLSDAQSESNEYTQTQADNISSMPMTLIARVTGTTAEPYCTNYASITITEGDVAQINSNIDSLTSCDDGNGTASFDLANMGTQITSENNPTITYYTTLEDAQSGINAISSQNAQLSSGTVYVRVEAQGKCPAISQFDVIVSPSPEAVIIAPVVDFCANDSIRLTAQNFDLTSQSYQWTGETGNDMGSDVEYIDVTSENGDQTITLTVTNTDTGCTNEDEVEVNSIPIPIIQELNVGDDSIEVVVTGEGPYEYSLDGINWQESPFLANLSPGLYDVYVRSITAQCTADVKSALVLNVSHVITPNGDGLNDAFVIPFMDSFKDDEGNVIPCTLQIFNRKGKMMYSEASSAEKTMFVWDGTYNGRTLGSGDYWYLLKLADGRNFSGHITVKNK